jgi:hypothetical protein
MLAVIARGQEATTAAPHPARTEFVPLGFMRVEP